jgi:NADH-quinone oxidoreductase chain I
MTEQTCSGQKKPKASFTGFVIKPIWATIVQTVRDSFGGRPNTVLYPNERLVLPDRYRGKHKVSFTRCIGCSQCVNICPNDCMWMKKIDDPVLGKIERPGVDYARCLFCGLCVDICPTDAIIETSEYELSSFDRKGLKYEPEQLRDDNCVVKEPKESVLIPVLDLDKCKAHEDCVKACPAKCIRMVEIQKTGKRRPEVDLSACTHCEKCVLACPEKAFEMEKRLEVMYERAIPDFKIDACTGCSACAKVCPVDAIYMADMPGTEKKKADGTMTKPKKRAVFILEKCIGCSRCSKTCKFSSIEMVPESRFKGVLR